MLNHRLKPEIIAGALLSCSLLKAHAVRLGLVTAEKLALAKKVMFLNPICKLIFVHVRGEKDGLAHRHSLADLGSTRQHFIICKLRIVNVRWANDDHILVVAN